MPTRHIPQPLVERIRRASKRLLTKKRFARMPNADHRGLLRDVPIGRPGGRVRELRLRPGNFNGKLVIKRVHNFKAEWTIQYITKMVEKHNQKYPDADYMLLTPHAYEVDKKHIVMIKTDKPNVAEIIGDGYALPTKRGRDFFSQLSKKYGVTEEDLKNAAKHIRKRTRSWFGLLGASNRNLIVIGVRNKKLVFLPLLDVY